MSWQSPLLRTTAPILAVVSLLFSALRAAADVPIDWSRYSPACGVQVAQQAGRLQVQWPVGPHRQARLVLHLAENEPLVERLQWVADTGGATTALLGPTDVAFWLTVGSRKTPPGKPEDQKWQVFFDKPVDRPHSTHRALLTPRRVDVASAGRRVHITIEGLEADRFRGSLRWSVYADCPLVHVEALLTTREDRVALLYDAGLVSAEPSWQQLEWIDTNDNWKTTAAAQPLPRDEPLSVRYRTVLARTSGGTVACFPPPHQYQFPRDWTNNFGFAWIGAAHQGTGHGSGFGFRQDEAGGGAFVPWFNAPPDQVQHLGLFLLLSPSEPQDALRDVLRYTHADRFAPLPGFRTLTSHWHMATAVAALERKKKREPDGQPDFVRIFKNMGVEMVHLAEFHGDGHQRDPGPLRLEELQSMFAECRRLSDDRLLLIPGEEINTFLGLSEPGKHPGHWMSLFPHPVYWILQREADQPFAEEIAPYGRVYRVGSRDDMIRLIQEEGALVWAAHPRIKASSWTPDIFRHEDFFVADYWLGGAWKAMPADLSQPRLGQRALDLMDDMANWGHRKYVLGEVDVFKLDRTHELYGHMNINYVRLDHVPRFDDGWQPVLDALRQGQFFVTTGEVLIPRFRVGGRESGQVLSLRNQPQPELKVELSWTFPLAFAEIISGDGGHTFRERIDLADTSAHGSRELVLHPQLADRKWVRFEVWDVARNGAFTQPVWLEQ